MILGVKVSRRLVAAAVFDGEAFDLGDARFVPTREGFASGIARYIRQLIEQVAPTAIYLYAPASAGKATAALVKAIDGEAGLAGVPVKPLDRGTLFGSFGLRPIRTRGEMRNYMVGLWAGLAEGKPLQQRSIAEAAAAALVGHVRQEWPPL